MKCEDCYRREYCKYNAKSCCIGKAEELKCTVRPDSTPRCEDCHQHSKAKLAVIITEEDPNRLECFNARERGNSCEGKCGYQLDCEWKTEEIKHTVVVLDEGHVQ